MTRITVLLADDHAIFREGTRKILDEFPELEVVGEAADGQQALELAGQLRPAVAILDIAMPGLSGIEVARRMASASPETKSLVLTAYDDDDYIVALLEAGAAGYLLKTVPARELVEAVRAVNNGQTVLHPAITQKLLMRLKQQPGLRAVPDEQLTEREVDVLKLVAQGLSNKQVAESTGLSVRTVEVHLSHIFAKLGVSSRMEAVLWGVSSGRLSLERFRCPGRGD